MGGGLYKENKFVPVLCSRSDFLVSPPHSCPLKPIFTGRTPCDTESQGLLTFQSLCRLRAQSELVQEQAGRLVLHPYTSEEAAATLCQAKGVRDVCISATGAGRSRQRALGRGCPRNTETPRLTRAETPCFAQIVACSRSCWQTPRSIHCKHKLVALLEEEMHGLKASLAIFPLIQKETFLDGTEGRSLGVLRTSEASTQEDESHQEQRHPKATAELATVLDWIACFPRAPASPCPVASSSGLLACALSRWFIFNSF